MIRLLVIAPILASVLAGCASESKQETPAVQAKPTFETKWNTTDKIDTPESAYFDTDTGSIFVSSVAGQPDGKDKKGWISRLKQDGSVEKSEFAKGFHAPKGMRSHKGTLWVTDIDEVVSIDIKTGKVKSRHKIKDAKFLNDIAIGNDGTVYVSDTAASKIHAIEGKKVGVFTEGAHLESPNGLLIDGDYLIVASWGPDMKSDFSTSAPGHLYSLHLKSREKKLITTQPLGHLDGLEKLPNGNYVVSDWMAGKVYSVSPAGQATLMLEGFKGSADLGIVPGAKLLLVPKMGENAVTAYGL